MEDARDLVADEQAFTSQEASESCIDLQVADLQLGVNGKLVMKFLVTTLFAGLAEGVYLEVIDGTGNTAGVIDAGTRAIATSPLIAVADLVAGKLVQVPIPPMKLQRYLGARWTPHTNPASSGNMTIGKSVSGESEIT